MLKNIFAVLDDRTDFPILIDDLLELFRKETAQDEILLFGDADMDEDRVRGFIRQFSTHAAPYSEPALHTHIAYATSQPLEWQRLTIAKELVHVADNGNVAPKTVDDVAGLLDAMADPLDLALLERETAQSINDRTALIPALGLLVPAKGREILRTRIEADQMSFRLAAEFALIPEIFMRMVLSDRFEALLPKFY